MADFAVPSLPSAPRGISDLRGSLRNTPRDVFYPHPPTIYRPTDRAPRMQLYKLMARIRVLLRRNLEAHFWNLVHHRIALHLRSLTRDAFVGGPVN